MPDIYRLTKQIAKYLNHHQVNQVRRAYYYAEQAHLDQKRFSGEPYITHPYAVAVLLTDMKMDEKGLMAALLHDVIEDSQITKQAISLQFGREVADIVDGVSKLAHINFRSRAHAQAENFQKMSLALAKDIRVILVKLADRLHNMSTLGVMPASKRRIKARETLEIYSPIANRLGMHNINVELEELSFSALYPLRYRLLMQAVKKIRGKRELLVKQAIYFFEYELKKNNITATVIGREKHLYSIYQKMKIRRKSFSEIMDVFGIRVLVQKKDDCYRILGIIHSVYKPFPGRFKDYIAIPKINGYQSLHTTLFGEKGTPIEVQMRTLDMDRIANYGIASHWLYKKTKDAELKARQWGNQRWIDDLLELQQISTNSVDFIENVKTSLFPDSIYVFTPKGDIIELPQGATVIDFAYALHTYIGNQCATCRINKQLSSLNTVLESGQTIEIITSNKVNPVKSWLMFSVSSKARSNIRHYLKNNSV
ncbi:MAG: bifunctional (p)ppGpp synthetase/guanosine-3',5'-bis(diphosphate) 3'-pyrophosphohydrolase [Endozoicomonadaceae bacterium]|nr:bifunctional (p)ppGpp synthetase/guanosine-3',5'-bis(diphosphate) 3'-pyrophosphohydrolase [Endozoicomonadaceae bacterium]